MDDLELTGASELLSESPVRLNDATTTKNTRFDSRDDGNTCVISVLFSPYQPDNNWGKLAVLLTSKHKMDTYFICVRPVKTHLKVAIITPHSSGEASGITSVNLKFTLF